MYGVDLTFIFHVGERFGFQDAYLPFRIYCDIDVGTFNSTDVEFGIFYNRTGFIRFTALENCSLIFSSNVANTSFFKDGTPFNGHLSVVSLEEWTVSWEFGAEILPSSYHTVIIMPGTYGTANPQGTFILPHGSTLQITAIPTNASYVFLYWQVLGGYRLGQNPYTLTILQDMTVTPVFKMVGVGGAATDFFSNLWFPIALVAIFGITVLLIKGSNQ